MHVASSIIRATEIAFHVRRHKHDSTWPSCQIQPKYGRLPASPAFIKKLNSMTQMSATGDSVYILCSAETRLGWCRICARVRPNKRLLISLTGIAFIQCMRAWAKSSCANKHLTRGPKHSFSFTIPPGWSVRIKLGYKKQLLWGRGEILSNDLGR